MEVAALNLAIFPPSLLIAFIAEPLIETELAWKRKKSDPTAALCLPRRVFVGALPVS